jgi:excisionase family DNA binding protein
MMLRSPEAVQRRTVTISEAATILGVSKPVVRRLIADGRLRHARAGTRVLVNRDDVDRFAEGDPEPAA